MSTGLKANSDGSAAIQVGGTDVITLTSGGAATFVTSPTTVQAGTAAAPSITFSGDTNTGIFSPAADTIAFTEGGVESMRIDSAGNFGLGVTPSAWKSNYKAVQVGNALSAVGRTDVNTIYLASNWYVNSSDQDVRQNAGFASLYAQADGQHRWYYAASSTAGSTITFTQAMTLDASSNLTILGGLTTGNNIAFTNSDPAINAQSGALRFATGGSERARISSGGSFSVGMTNFTGSLSDGVGFGVDPTGYLQITRNQAPPIVACRTVSTGAIINLAYGSTNTNGATLGNISTNGSTISYNPSSDRRLKEDIQPMRDALTAVMKLKPVTYKWKNTGIADDGFIAQDLLETPEFTHRVNSIGKAEDESDIYGVDYMKFVSVLTAAIQEQQAMIDELKAKVAALEGA